MLDYTAHRPAAAARHSSPNTMLFIIAGHVAAVAAVMSARMDLPVKIQNLPIDIINIPAPMPPEAQRPTEQPKTRPAPAPGPTLPDPLVSIPADPVIPADPNPSPPLPLPQNAFPGSGSGEATARPIPATPAILLTGADELKPPYPASKLASGEEAVLKLRLTIAANGRVAAVEPIGRADPQFLASARRHILAHWRYRPASRDGHGVAATLVVSLRFQLDE